MLLSEKCLQQKLSIETGCSDKIQEKLYAMWQKLWKIDSKILCLIKLSSVHKAVKRETE